GRQRHLLHMDFQDLHPALDIGQRHRHAAIETARAQQRGVEYVGTVGRRDDDDALVRVETVHLDQQLVRRLFALVAHVAEARAASMPATSAKVTLPSFCVSIFARLLPKPIAPEPLDFCIWRSTKKARPRKITNGSDWTSRYCQIDGPSSGLPENWTPLSRSRW